MSEYKVWYNRRLSESKAAEFLRKYRVYDNKVLMKIAMEGDLKEFKLLCNALGLAVIHGMVGFSGNSVEVYKLRDACNERIKERMGEEATKLFELFSKSQKHEYWMGDERYKLYSFDFGSYADRQVIKSVVAYMAKYNGKEGNTEDVKCIGSLYSSGLSPNLYKEDGEYIFDWNDIDSNYIKANRSKKKHLNLWFEFMEYVWDRKWDKAYELMVKWQRKTGKKGWDYI